MRPSSSAPANWVERRASSAPSSCCLDADPAGDAEVVEREFRGHDLLYRVRLADGTVLRSQRPSNEAVPLGAACVSASHVTA